MKSISRHPDLLPDIERVEMVNSCSNQSHRHLGDLGIAGCIARLEIVVVHQREVQAGENCLS